MFTIFLTYLFVLFSIDTKFVANFMTTIFRYKDAPPAQAHTTPYIVTRNERKDIKYIIICIALKI